LLIFSSQLKSFVKPVTKVLRRKTRKGSTYNIRDQSHLSHISFTLLSPRTEKESGYTVMKSLPYWQLTCDFLTYNVLNFIHCLNVSVFLGWNWWGNFQMV